MPVHLSHIREQLLPGLWQIGINQRASYRWVAATGFEPAWSAKEVVALSGKEVAVLGAAAILAKNPVVSRRFFSKEQT